MTRLRTLLAGLLLTGTAAQAATVQLSSPADLTQLAIGATFQVDVSGEGFDSAVVGGAFALSFDPAILRLEGWAPDRSVWNLGGNRSAQTGDYFFNAFSITAKYPKGAFNIGDLSFSVIGTGETSIALSDPTLNWATTGGQAYPGQDQIQYSSLAVKAVPIPAGLWLFGSGLVGLARLRRKACAR